MPETPSTPGRRRTLWGGAAGPPCLLETLTRTAARCPDAVAVEDDGLRLTYVRLFEWAGEITGLLRAEGVGPRDRVAVSGPRGATVVAAFLGTVLLGATYVPLDSEYPAKRLAHMLDDSGAKVLLHTGRYPDAPTAARPVRIPDPPAAGRSPLRPEAVDCRPELPVYVIYTSGSTGWPKGVAIPHSCLDNMAAWQVAHSPRPDLRTAQFSPLNFDVCFQEILGTLCGGGTLVIMPERLRRDAFGLLEWLVECRVERLFLPGVALNMLAVAAGALDSLDGLRLVEVNTAGEQLVCSPAIRALFRRLPGTRLCNHYGQSESAMVTSHVLDGPSEAWPTLPPIGVPLPGCELLVDPADPAEPAVGELLVAGLPVSLGYLGLPELNRERYVTVGPTPRGHTRAFRTGDLVRLQDGLVHYLGRLGHEVKIRGIRVNPLETEAWLLDRPGIREAVCVVVETSPGSRVLRAAVTLDPRCDPPDLEEVRADLAEVLPEVGVPLSVTVLPDLARTPSGKIDRIDAEERIRRATAGVSRLHTASGGGGT